MRSLLFALALLPIVAQACESVPSGADEIVYHRELSGYLARMVEADRADAADHVIRYAEGGNSSKIIIVDQSGCAIVTGIVEMDFWATAKLAAGLSSERFDDPQNTAGF